MQDLWVEMHVRVYVEFMGFDALMSNVCWKCVVGSVVDGVYACLRPLGTCMHVLVEKYA